MDLENLVTCEIIPIEQMCQLVLPLCQLAEPRFIKLREQRKVMATRNKVRFSDNDSVKLLTAPRSQNTKSVKEPYVCGDFRQFQCKYGGYIENADERSILIANNMSNNHISFVKEPIMSLKEVKTIIKRNYLSQPDPVAYSSNELLMNYSKVHDYPMDFLIDCVIYMMDVYIYIYIYIYIYAGIKIHCIVYHIRKV